MPAREWSRKIMWASAIGFAISSLCLLVGCATIVTTSLITDDGTDMNTLRTIAIWVVLGSIIGLVAAAASFSLPLAGAGGMALASLLYAIGVGTADYTDAEDTRNLLIALTLVAVVPLLLAVGLSIAEHVARQRITRSRPTRNHRRPEPSSPGGPRRR